MALVPSMAAVIVLGFLGWPWTLVLIRVWLSLEYRFPALPMGGRDRTLMY